MAIGVAPGHGSLRLVQRQGFEGLGIALVLAQLFGPGLELGLVRALGALDGIFDQIGAHQRRDADVLLIDPACQLVAPGFEVVDPGDHAVEVAARGLGGEGGEPLVVAARCHFYFLRAGVGFGAPTQHHAQHVVPVGEAVRLDAQGLARDGLDGETACVHHR